MPEDSNYGSELEAIDLTQTVTSEKPIGPRPEDATKSLPDHDNPIVKVRDLIEDVKHGSLPSIR